MVRRLVVLAVAAIALGALAGPAAAAGPTAIGTDSDGVSYVGFERGQGVARYAGANGERLGSFGTAGSAIGQIGGVVAIDVAPGPSGTVWILDDNLRVQEFTRSGTYVRGRDVGFCDRGTAPFPGTGAGGLDVTATRVYVAHPCADRVVSYRRSDLGEVATTSVADPGGISAQIYDTAPESSRRLFVAQRGFNRVVALDRDHLSLRETRTYDFNPLDVFVDAFGVLFVSELNQDRIHLYDQSGSEFRWIGGTGSEVGRLQDPVAFDVFEQYSDFAGNLFIADRGNERVQRMNPFGFTFWAAPAASNTGGGGGGGATAPANDTPPRITGTARTGQTLTCQPGEWRNGPTAYAYEWLRDGSVVATGQTYTVVAADVGRSVTCRVTASNSAGQASATSAAVVPTDGGTPTAGRVGVSIDDGAVFTDTLGVTLRIRHPEGATGVLIANDGGFDAAEQRAISADGRYPWALRSSGAERLPRVVYVRFTGPGIDGDKTFTDDIILDETAPRTTSATLVPSGGGGKARRAAYRLRVRARDGLSGVARVQFATRRAGRVKTRPYRRSIPIRSRKSARWVRVVDHAGNVGRWKRVRVRTRR